MLARSGSRDDRPARCRRDRQRRWRHPHGPAARIRPRATCARHGKRIWASRCSCAEKTILRDRASGCLGGAQPEVVVLVFLPLLEAHELRSGLARQRAREGRPAHADTSAGVGSTGAETVPRARARALRARTADRRRDCTPARLRMVVPTASLRASSVCERAPIIALRSAVTDRRRACDRTARGSAVRPSRRRSGRARARAACRAARTWPRRRSSCGGSSG